MRAAIVDYGMGNLFSVKHACRAAGLETFVTSSKEEILTSAAVILPGVGAFGDAMEALHRLDLVSVLKDVVAAGRPLLGICLGMQLLMTESHEFGRHRGLGLIEGEVLRFEGPRDGSRPLRVPQVGWNRLQRPVGVAWSGGVLDGLEDGEFMYFVHSFYAKPADRSVVLAVSHYGQIEFCSGLRRGRVAACQFHPERSGPEGLKIYKNFAAQTASAWSEVKRV
jgi:imidazole glycerol-phosphate synthase subunit HisH